MAQLPQIENFYHIPYRNNDLFKPGVDKQYIRTFLGNDSIKTTKMYTHIAITKLSTIINPLIREDDIKKVHIYLRCV